MTPLETSTRIILLGLVILLYAFNASVSGEDATKKQGADAAVGASQDRVSAGPVWAGINLRENRLYLKSAREVRFFDFEDDEIVSVALGKKGEAAMDNSCHYKTDREWLQISNSEGKVVFRMRPRKITRSDVTVENEGGKVDVYQIVRMVKPISTPFEGGRWMGLEFDGLILELKNERVIRRYLFNLDGFVSATFGERRGTMVRPVLRWKQSGDWLQILDGDGMMLHQMRAMHVSAQEIIVDNGFGKEEAYLIQRNVAPPQSAAPAGKP